MSTTRATRPRHDRACVPTGRYRSRLFPAEATTYAGPRAAATFLVAANVIATGRSLVHVFAPDSGAGTIASMATTGPGGANAVGLLAQWGGAQLLEAGIIWVVVARYRGLIPLMLGVVTAEQALRIGIGLAKPLVTQHTPPGAVSWLLLPVAAAAFLASLRTGRTTRRDADDAPGVRARGASEAPVAH